MAKLQLPLLGLVVLSELVWFFFFLNTHLLYKVLLSLDFLAIFLIFLAIATIDLAVILTLVLVQSNLLMGSELGNSGEVRDTAFGLNSFAGSAMLKVNSA